MGDPVDSFIFNSYHEKMQQVLSLVYEYVGFTKDIQRKTQWCKRPPDDEENPFEIDEMPVFMQKRWCHHFIVKLFMVFETPHNVLRARRTAIKLRTFLPVYDGCIFS